jgi:hypothetical protein
MYIKTHARDVTRSKSKTVAWQIHLTTTSSTSSTVHKYLVLLLVLVVVPQLNVSDIPAHDEGEEVQLEDDV